MVQRFGRELQQLVDGVDVEANQLIILNLDLSGQLSCLLQVAKDEFKELLRAAGSRLVVVEFSARWCGPCKRVGPIFQAMSLKYQNVTFANVDVDSSKELAQLCHIKAVPTFQMFKHTKKIYEFHGADEQKLEAKIQELM
ncbi:thioredoxin domain-containing protein 8 [Alexandromys fortis]|uniref:thioredoxin domain-containing protein 8 n=1 Tax=Alexandromys fortis TaxID=100897 RepID=UPI0021536672|nr:thioredoxin domain-containing protein 8 [Microtus fortis]